MHYQNPGLITSKSVFVAFSFMLLSFVELPAQSVFDDPASPNLMATGRAITPVGQLLANYGRPVDLQLSRQGATLFVKAHGDLWVVNATDGELMQTLPIPGGASSYGIAVSKTDDVFVTNSKNLVCVYSKAQLTGPDATPRYKLNRKIELAADSYPCGIELSKDESTIYVCLSKKNSLAVIDLNTDSMSAEIPVGVAPFDVVLSSAGKLVVSNLGGRRARAGDETAKSSGTETVVDKRGIANTGTVTVIDVSTHQVDSEIVVGLQPSSMCWLNRQLVVCNTNEDTISFVPTDGGRSSSFVVKPDKRLPFGSMPSSVTVSPDEKTLFVALAGNNAVSVIDVSEVSNPRIVGLIPTAWYPASLDCNEADLFVGSIKGIGARAVRRDRQKGWNSHDHQGTVQRIALADIADSEILKGWTESVMKNSRVAQGLRSSLGGAKDKSVTPEPVPQKRGQPSVFKHVIYVVKENRTFDQVFGDVEEARSDPRLCIFPDQITPNHHALAKRFGLLDNYYCNGVLSADGHSWATEGNVTPYLERAFGGFARSYTFGDDPITYSSSGFVWDRVLAAGLSFRNYGEMDYAKQPSGMNYVDIYKAYLEGKQLEFGQQIGIKRLRRYSCREYPGWNMSIPDVLRVDRFLKEFREFEKDGSLPSLCMIYLPQDHLGGGVVSRSHMADNDLALGRLVEAVSHSEYWKDTVIFVNEDDPQNGYDHIDGHRSLCLVISAFSRPGVNHTFYNQTSVLRTMLHLLGLPPLNQQDASMPLMRNCFDATADLSPYDAVPANFALDELPQPKQQQSSVEKKWRILLTTVPIQRTGMKTEQDEDNLNRFVWHEMRGWGTPYPTGYAGGHARGLRNLGLEIKNVSGN